MHGVPRVLAAAQSSAPGEAEVKDAKDAKEAKKKKQAGGEWEAREAEEEAVELGRVAAWLSTHRLNLNVRQIHHHPRHRHDCEHHRDVGQQQHLSPASHAASRRSNKRRRDVPCDIPCDAERTTTASTRRIPRSQGRARRTRA